MSSKSCLPAALALALVAALAPAVQAGDIRLPAGTPRQIDGPATHVTIGSGFQGGTCEVGGARQALQSLPEFIQNGDSYFTLLDPLTCVDCSETHTLTVDQVHIGLFFNTACSLPVEISIVETIPEAGCYLPNDDVQLMTPLPKTLIGTGPGLFVFHIDLIDPVCVRGPAFLMVRVTSIDPACVAVEARPELTYDDTSPCPLCHYFFLTDGGGSGDLCDPSDTPQMVPLQQWVSGSCCALMPVKQNSWGELKLRYRP